jgi:hypothetical protein
LEVVSSSAVRFENKAFPKNTVEMHALGAAGDQELQVEY